MSVWVLWKKNDNYTSHYWLGVLAEITEDYDGALKHFHRAAEIKPYSEEPWLHIDMTHRRKGELEASHAASDKLINLAKRKLEVDAKDTISLSRLAANYARRGETASALEAIEKVLELAPNDGLVLYNCACTYAHLGKKNEAFGLLQKAIGIGYKNIIEWVENDPDLEAYREDPQFKEILMSG